MLKAALSASANSSMGLSEEVAEWTDGSELLVLVQHFNSITFLHERNLQIIPALISWQKVLVIFGSTCLEGDTDGLFCHFRACATLQLRVLGLVLSPCPGTGHRDGQSSLASAGADTATAACVCTICKHQPFQNEDEESYTEEKREGLCLSSQGLTLPVRFVIWEKPVEEFEMSKMTERNYKVFKPSDCSAWREEALG